MWCACPWAGLRPVKARSLWMRSRGRAACLVWHVSGTRRRALEPAEPEQNPEGISVGDTGIEPVTPAV